MMKKHRTIKKEEPLKVLKSHWIIILLLLSSTHNCLNANPEDSLLVLLYKTTNQERKIELLITLQEQTYLNNTSKSLEYAQKAIALSKTVGNQNFLTKAYQKAAISNVLLYHYDQSTLLLDSALIIAQHSNNRPGIASCKRNQGTLKWYQNDIPEAIKLYKESLSIFEDLADEQQIATTVSNIGTAYYAIGDYSNSIIYYNKALEMLDRERFPNETSTYLNDIGAIYKEWGNRGKALEYFLEALEINRKINNHRGMASNIDNIGSIHFEEGDFDKALSYFKQGLTFDSTIQNINGCSYSYLSISAVYLKKENLDSVVHYLTLAKNGFEKIDDKLGLVNTLLKFGKVSLLKNELKKSKNYYTEAITSAREVGDEKGLATAFLGIGQIMLKENNFALAIKNFNQSVIYAKSGNYVNVLMENYKALWQSYKKLNNDKQTITALENYIEVRDTVQFLEKKRQASELLAKYETKKKEDEIKILNQQNTLNNNQLTRQRTIIGSILFLLFITVGGIFLIFRRLNEKKRINLLLETKNKEINFKQIQIEKQNTLLEIQTLKLQELDELKTRFFTNISHEFRTPLTLIIGPVEQLLISCSDEKTKSMLNRVMTNARNLLGLINQLLEISKIEKGEVKLRFSEGNLAEELGYIIEMFRNAAIEKSVELNFISNIKNLKGYFDREKVERILFNLLSNALKNTEKGKIEVQLEESSTPNWVKISVADTGKGIEQEKIPLIFDRFYTSDSTTEGKKASSGIGLAFTKELITIYKGKVNVISEQGKGTQFTVELPFTLDIFEKAEYEMVNIERSVIEAEPKVVLIHSDEKQEPMTTENTETILLVEDHEELRKFIASNLIEKYRVLEAENGKIGIEMALKHHPDIIITDVMMPEVDGLELAKTLKSNEETCHIPIIMLTAKASEESRIAGLETQVDDYLTKPFSYRELAVRIKNLLTIRARLREKFRRSITVEPSEITTNSRDEQLLSRLLTIVEENMTDTDFSVETLCDKAGISRTALHNKLKSLLDQSATEFINAIRMKRAAQLLKSNSGSISEVAYQVGFNNLSYFNRLFKKHFDQTPSEMIG